MKVKMIVVIICICIAVPALAAIKTIGKGESMRLDTANFSAQMKTNYEIMKVKCVKCHSLERTIVALNTRISPVSGMPFDRNAIKAYGNQMKRRSGTNMNAQEINACVDLMNYLWDEAIH